MHEGSLAQHLFLFNPTDTAGYVAAILERAGVVEVDRGRPNRVRLSREWASA